ncbi:hypothetical protein ACFWNG_07900 [Streptomyces sp. NPDC058391]|uniref:hypothetical protein n=1 Tax=Streptomyces sp. NPDC058391 TaxID=3346476 RepID=UPI003659F0B0
MCLKHFLRLSPRPHGIFSGLQQPMLKDGDVLPYVYRVTKYDPADRDESVPVWGGH